MSQPYDASLPIEAPISPLEGRQKLVEKIEATSNPIMVESLLENLKLLDKEIEENGTAVPTPSRPIG
jgi:hypothetical protein